MFKSAEIAQQVDKKTYQKERAQMRTALLEAQFDIAEAKQFPVIVIIAGMDGAGKREVINVVNTLFDTRHAYTIAFDLPDVCETRYPSMWRYWKVLPAKGDIAVFMPGWYSEHMHSYANGDIDKDAFVREMERINRFEKMLADEGALIIKFWLHLSKEGQKERFKKFKASPRDEWRTTDTFLGGYKNYDRVVEMAEAMVHHTDHSHAPWLVFNSEDEHYTSLTIGKTLLSSLQKRIEEPSYEESLTAPVSVPALGQKTVFDTLDYTLALAKPDYKQQLRQQQNRLHKLMRCKGYKNHSIVLVFEGNDAAGKGGAIRRVVESLDARLYRVNQVAAPSDEELARPYLWRFWRRLPAIGHVGIYDRSWYGRVLVERVEGFCSEADWRRAYSEINDFERELYDNNTIVVKFWLAISKDEQLTRFKAREETGYKRYKITEEDWRNREKWEQYEAAVVEMIDRTSTEHAPWTIIEAESKYYARVKVLKTLCDRLEQEFSED